MAINTGRVVGGGLIAGVVMNALDAVWGMFVMKADYQAMAARMGMDPKVMDTLPGMLPWIICDLVIGFVVVWTYAGFRPRFGAGPKTAIFAGLVPYIAVTAVLYAMASMGVMSTTVWCKGSALALVSVMAGSIAGSWFYKE